MKTMIQLDLLTILGFVATLIFGALSVLFYFRSRKHKRLSFIHRAIVLQSKAHPEVTIAFRGKEIVNLSQLRVVCWNSGSQEIRWSDIPEGESPKLVFESDTRILSAALAVATEHTGFRIMHIDDHTIGVRFTYLNPGDFGAAEVLFESAVQDVHFFEVVAPVIGGLPTSAERFEAPLGRIDSVSLLGGPLLIAGLGFLLGTRVFIEPNWLTPAGGLGLLGAVCALCIGIFGFVRNLRDRRHSKLPAAAQSFFR